ncbi:MAG: 23S rRNA (adenine(2503)-C(2))-methyltransferase RlmN [Eubacteriales bacterium]|nr:23S rRNA (adenine(2503)-C(2))-methyltransferase RlmN [Eubacteriales bacterium]
MQGINDLTIEQLKSALEQIPQAKGFRSKQIIEWIYKGVASFDEMTNVSRDLRERLAEEFTFHYGEIEQRFPSKIDGTIKYLLRLADGHCVEAVLMRYKHGNTICLSTQVGCLMGCKFCASTIGGKIRDLTAGEMISQIYAVQKDIGERISNIVLMGIGEPLDNYDNVLAFLHNVNEPMGLNIGYRHISLSTCGLINEIDRLADEELPITLSVSLHAPTNEIRDKIMPVNKKYPVEQLIAACKRYIKKTGRRISFEYILIDGVNDTPQAAQSLGDLLKGMLCHVNLIPANEVEETGMKRTPPHVVKVFQKKLEDKGLTVTVRRELGSDIKASCGQLRKNRMEQNA